MRTSTSLSMNWYEHKKILYSPYLSIARYKGIQDSLGFWIPRHEFQIPVTGFQILCQWNLDSELNP